MKRPVFAALAVCFACSQQAEPIDESEKPTPPAAEGEVTEAAMAPEPEGQDAPALDPVQTCEALVEAAREGDAEAFGALATDAAVEAMAKDEKVTEGVIAAISKAVCGEATVEGERATVGVAVGDETRKIPFVRVQGAWKFDGAGYLQEYPMVEEAPPPSKKGKKGKRRKKRRRKG